jgi:uncharacterized membrane protein
MPMIPTSLNVLVLFAAFMPSASAFFLRIPHRRLLNGNSVMMVAVAALMLFTLVLAVFSLVGSIPLWQRAAAAKRARERQIAEHRARGH